MRICMLLDDAFPPDIRVSKEAKSLVAAGHEVTLLCQYDGGQRRERVGPVDVVRVPVFEEYGSLDDLTNGSYYLGARVHLPWSRALTDHYESEPFDALHVHDLPLVKTGIRWADGRDVDVVADLHENWPEAKRQYRKRTSLSELTDDPKSALDRLATPIWRLKRLERTVVQEADRVVAVVEEGKRHYVECGADPDDVYVVPNYVDTETFLDGDVAAASLDGEFVLLYVGTIGAAHRGLKTVIRAMPTIAEAVPDPRFVVVGDGPYVGELRRECRELGVDDLVEFTGWVDFERLPSYIAASDVCVVPHRDNPHTATTIPHKLTQYMALGKPAIVTDVEPLARVVTDADAGRVVPAGSPHGLAGAAVDLYEDPDRLAALGDNARRAVETTYNWATAGAQVCSLYEGMTGERPRSASAPVQRQ